MSQQVNFYLLENDIIHISSYLREEGFVFLSPDVKDEYFEVVDSLTTMDVLSPYNKKQIILKEDLARFQNGRNVCSFEYSPSPLFLFPKNALGKGRFYTEDLPFEQIETEHKEVFRETVERFFRWFERQFPIKDDDIFYGIHTSQAVIEKVESDGLRILLNNSIKDLGEVR